jgi:putative hydrolase of the HAD superfamily
LDFLRVRAVTFDAGGTLLAPHPGVGEIYSEVLGRHGIKLEPSLLEIRFRQIFGEMRGNPRAVISESTERSFWFEVVRRCVTSECSPELLNKLFPDLWEEFATARRWRPRSGALELLKILHARGRQRLAVLSNWDSRLHRVIAELGWKNYFSGVFISSEIGAEKPHSRVFRAVEKSLALPAAACLHIGDSLAHDYHGARAAGWQALLVGRPPSSSIHPVAHVNRLEEIHGLLK